ncbi:MAG: hemolysin family protein [Candidatus Glassbacteria bacterium]
MEPYLLIILPVLLVLSALFSSSETAYFSLSSFEILQLEEENPARGRVVRRLLENPDLLLNGILLGNLVVNVCATAVATILLHTYGLEAGWSEKVIYFTDVVGMTFILIVFCEVSPKVHAIVVAKKQALRLTWFMQAWLFLAGPFIRVLVWISSWFKKLFAASSEDRQMLEEELKLMVDMSAEQGDLDIEEKMIIHNIFELSDKMVREIMVPRTDIHGFSIDTPLEEIIRQVREIGFSRYPIYQGDLDDIRGFLYAKDLLGYCYNFKKPASIEELMREVYYVPETKRCSETLREFQERRHYMGIVVDEFGGTEGLVTVEDIMEEIIGEIQDEHDEEEPLIVQQDENTWLMDGKINIEDLTDSLGLKISEDEGYETLGGFIFTHFGRLPYPGESLDYGGLRFVITKLARRRILKVRIARLPQPEQSPGGDR